MFTPICLPIPWFWNYKYNPEENNKGKAETILNNSIETAKDMQPAINQTQHQTESQNTNNNQSDNP